MVKVYHRGKKRRLESLGDNLNRIEGEIDFLKANFRPSPEVNKFMRALQGERSYVIRQIHIGTQSQKEREEDRQERLAVANKNRSEKMKRTWRFVDAIQRNYYPKKSKKRLRSELT